MSKIINPNWVTDEPDIFETPTPKNLEIATDESDDNIGNDFVQIDNVDVEKSYNRFKDKRLYLTKDNNFSSTELIEKLNKLHFTTPGYVTLNYNPELDIVETLNEKIERIEKEIKTLVRDVKSLDSDQVTEGEKKSLTAKTLAAENQLFDLQNLILLNTEKSTNLTHKIDDSVVENKTPNHNIFDTLLACNKIVLKNMNELHQKLENQGQDNTKQKNIVELYMDPGFQKDLPNGTKDGPNTKSSLDNKETQYKHKMSELSQRLNRIECMIGDVDLLKKEQSTNPNDYSLMDMINSLKQKLDLVTDVINSNPPNNEFVNNNDNISEETDPKTKIENVCKEIMLKYHEIFPHFKDLKESVNSKGGSSFTSSSEKTNLLLDKLGYTANSRALLLKNQETLEKDAQLKLSQSITQQILLNGDDRKKINQLYEMLKGMEPSLMNLPSIQSELKSLNHFIDMGTEFENSLAELKNTQNLLQNELLKNRETYQQIKEHIKGNLEIMIQNNTDLSKKLSLMNQNEHKSED